MRRLSRERRMLVTVSASVAAMSGVAPALARRHPAAEWCWLGLEAAVLVFVAVRMWRLRRSEGCCE